MFSSLRSRSALAMLRRNAGWTTGTPQEVPLIPRGKIPCPPNNYRLWAASIAIFGSACAFRHYMAAQRTNVLKEKWFEWQENGFAPWRDFENPRMPKWAKALANESPCGDSFKEAYLCAVFGEDGACNEKFESFLSCVKEVPELNQNILPDGKFNWPSKLFQHQILKEKEDMTNMFDSVGPADQDMEDVFNDYRARHILGPNATEKEVEAFKSKLNGLKTEFFDLVEKMFNGESEDYKKAQELYEKINKEFSVPKDVWMQVLKDYDVEEFDDVTSYYRRVYSSIFHKMKKYDQSSKVMDVQLDSVTCGATFDKLYKCMANKRESECADFVDQLFFCRQNNYKMVWPKTATFDQPDASFKAEIERAQEVMTYPPTSN